LNTLGPTCIVKKVAPVLKENYVFVRLVKITFNNLELKRQPRKNAIAFFCENYIIVRYVSASVVGADPDLYWECGSGSGFRSTEMTKINKYHFNILNSMGT
jgi:hypothetical protein